MLLEKSTRSNEARKRAFMSDPKSSSTSPVPLLTAAEIAARLNISLRTVRRLITQKKLPVVRIGRSVRIRSEALATLIGEE
jgi:excisionase family DNA binding protein